MSLPRGITTRARTGLLVGLLAASGFLAALKLPLAACADPEGQGQAAPQQFLSGGARSIAVLQEIKDVLERMDARLQHIEEGVARLNQPQPPMQPPPLDVGGNRQ
jgi:hypothetical protein